MVIRKQGKETSGRMSKMTKTAEDSSKIRAKM